MDGNGGSVTGLPVTTPRNTHTSIPPQERERIPPLIPARNLSIGQLGFADAQDRGAVPTSGEEGMGGASLPRPQPEGAGPHLQGD